MRSYLVIGMGRFGRSVATELYRMKQDVLVVDEDEDNVTGIINQVTDVIIGDAKDEAVMNSLNVYSFDCVIVAMAGALEDSILTTMMLKELGAKYIVCKAQNERHSKILSQLGADRVIHPESDMGKRVARSLIHKNIVDYLDVSPDYGIMEIVSPKSWVDKSIMKNNLRRKYGITVITIRSAETNHIDFSPGADTVINESDILTIIGL